MARHLIKRCLLGAAALSFCVAAAMLFSLDERWVLWRHAGAAEGRVPLAVLGDSDSHSYQDRVTFPVGTDARGGRHADKTWQWVDVLQRLRGDEIDLGPWGTWGSRFPLLGRLQSELGLRHRRIQKQDFHQNLARSGARCEDMNTGAKAQLPRLLDILDQDPQRWARGVVVIRIGINNVGIEPFMEGMARGDQPEQTTQGIDACVRHIRETLAGLRQRHPETAVVLVGIFNNAHWARWLGRWHDPAALARIEAGLDRFDAGLKHLAATHARVVFFDDRAWFVQRFGGRDARGVPAYLDWQATPWLKVTNSLGDTWQHAYLADGHNGSVWNAAWAATLTGVLHEGLKLPVTPIAPAAWQGLFH